MSKTSETVEEQEVRELQRVVIKEELVELTGKHFEAALLNNLIFWHGITDKMDQSLLVQISQLEKRGAKQGTINKKKKQIRDGWFFKTADELSAELIGWGSPQKIGRALNELSKNGWIEKGNNPDPKMKWDRTTWLKVNINKIATDLFKIGYALEGYSLVQETEEKPKGFESNSAKKASLRKFHFGICKFHFGSSKFQNGRTIPEGLLQKVTSEKEFEEEENNTLRVSESMLLILMNQKIKDREITNKKTIKAIHDVVSKCKAIGTTDLTAAENYVIKVVEEKMSKLGQKQKVRTGKANVSRSKSVRSEMVPDWIKEDREEQKEYSYTPEKRELKNWDDLTSEFKNVIFPSITKAINNDKDDESISAVFGIVVQDIAALRKTITEENQKRLNEILKKRKGD
ncbi:hypothetical protein [Bacillus cereus]|uniref:hypothetical protein n=1 Tax=Bacillus cereus TaxID=1396 RepID=UPI000A302489|nr:hypothetical protein [Bacillus cereus]MCU4880434.1 hypothetical protein [Bacillus cereus]MCU5352528.1 hypothetical protein [Bacillus cereus]SMD94994.1 hypothetical protein BACERE00187_02368 [Bacillus cereus]